MMGINDKVKVAVCGDFQGGKSTLVNCLLDDKYCQTGKGGGGLRTTPCSTIFSYDQVEIAEWIRQGRRHQLFDRREDIFDASKFSPGKNDWVEITCWKPLLENINLVDTPGFDANHADDMKAEEAIKASDYIVFLHSSGKTLSQQSIDKLKKIVGLGKEFFFIYNCLPKNGILSWNPNNENNKKKYGEILSQLDSLGLSKYIIPIEREKIFPCNPIFAWYAMGHLQRDLDSKDLQEKGDAESYIEDIAEFWKTLKGRFREKKLATKIDKKELLELSGVVEIRKAIAQTCILYKFKRKADEFFGTYQYRDYSSLRDTESIPYQTAGGWRQDFGNEKWGVTLTLRPYDTIVFEVHGAIRETWLKAGAEKSKYGWPTSNELSVLYSEVLNSEVLNWDARSSNFECGSIAWTGWEENRIIGTFDNHYN